MTTVPLAATPPGERAAAVTALDVRTVALAERPELLDLLPETAPLAWVQGGEGLVGWGEVARYEMQGSERFAQAQSWWTSLASKATVHDEVRRPGTGLVAFGSFTFDPEDAGSVLRVPEVVVGHRDGCWWVTTIGAAAPAAPVTPVQRPSNVSFEESPDRDAAWQRTVASAVARIGEAPLEKVVLARDLIARAAAPIDVRWPLSRLAEDYPGCWVFCVEGLLGATPELLLRLVDGVATSRVLAGTLRRTGDDNEDRRRSDDLARSIKDVEEHGYGVRSVVDALARHCTSVEVPAAPFVLELRNVMHLATDVRGQVTDGASSLQIVSSLHPSAAVCGSPTPMAMALIREVELLDRGRYAGPVGWLGAGGDGEWGIALRCGQVDPQDPSRLTLYAGCGIVAGSSPVRELAESNAKLVPMRDALTR